jgi:acyl carrier protein
MADQLMAVVADVLCVEEKTLTSDSGRDSLAVWDSLAHLQIIAGVEERFGVKIPFEDVALIRCIRDFEKYIPQ